MSLTDGEIEGLWLKYTGQCNIISVGDMEAISERVCVYVGAGGRKFGMRRVLLCVYVDRKLQVSRG